MLGYRSVFVSLATFSVLLYALPLASAEIVTFNNLVAANTSSGFGLNLSSSSGVALSSAHLAWNGTEQPMGSPESLSNPNTARRVFGLNGVRLMPMGPTDLNNPPPQLPDYSYYSYNFTSFPIYGAGDGIAFAIPTGSNYTYGILRINGFSGPNLTISYKINNQTGNRTISAASAGGVCGQYTTEQTCFSNPSCFWDFGFQFCKEETGGGGGGGGGGFVPYCDFLDGQQSKCQNVTVCFWDTLEGGICENNNTVFNYTTGIVCSNLNQSSLCNNFRDIFPLCSWNTTAARCQQNTSKTFSDFAPPPVPYCEAATNQSVCNQLFTDFFMPCEWQVNNISNTSKCGFRFGNIFVGDVQNIFDITTEQACKSAGGTFKTETYQTTNTYGQTVTDTKSWCEFDFGYGGGGFSKQSCNEACWACEKNGTSNWANVNAAQTACENSSLGFCKWSNNSFSLNSLGFCSPDSALSFGGGGDCSSFCGACFKSSACSSSPANCSWLPDPFSYDINGDGSFDNLTDGTCFVKAIAEKKDCSKTCNACQSQSACTSSPVAGGCSWNTTASGFQVCVPNGPPQEICFIPGDEDGDGLADCSDINATGGSCSQDPSCGFGASGAGIGGPGGGFGAFDENICIRWDNNQSACGNQKGPAGTPLVNESVCFYHPAPGQMQNFPAVGWCDPLSDQEGGGGMDLDQPPTIVGADPIGDVSAPYLDIGPVGIHEEGGKGSKFDIGMALRNVSTAAWCKKSYPSQNQNRSSLYVRYIDIDENTTNGCALESNSSNRGWDFKFRHYENATVDQKMSLRCVNNSWVPFTAQISVMEDMCTLDFGPMDMGPGPAPGSAAADFANISAVHIMVINKADIGSPKKVLRIYVAAGNETRNESSPVDTAGPFFYTPGSIDVKFENCAVPGSDSDGDGLATENDPDCQFFLKQGFISFEMGPQCQDGADNDGNGKTDCNDPQCKYDPFGLCNSGQGLVCDATDKKSPSLKWLDVKTFPDFAFIKFDSDEPANGTILFYRNDSSCQTLNATVRDFALLNAITADDFKPWHDVQLGLGTLNYSLTGNRTYYYKFVMSDICGNKLTSACSNFTTPTSFSSFVFKPVPPPGVVIDIPELGVTNDNFSYAKQYNASQTKSVSLKIKDSTNGFIIDLQNSSILKASTLNISTLYMQSSGEKYVGMNTSTWSKIQTDFFPSTINITLPDNGTALFKCDEGNLSNCVNVTSVATCTFGTANTTCTLPLAAGLGFSVYKVTGETAGSSSTTTTTTTSGGGGGGGGGAAAPTVIKSTTSLESGDTVATYASLQTAIAESLGLGELDKAAIDNLVGRSAEVSADTAVEKTIATSGGKTTLTTKVTYSGAVAETFMVYDKIPKDFASTADKITVVAFGGTVKVVNADPEYLITYPQAVYGQSFTIAYTKNGTAPSSVVNSSKTEIYAAGAPAAPEQPAEAPAEQPPGEEEQVIEIPPVEEGAMEEETQQITAPVDFITVAAIIAIIAIIAVLLEARHKKKAKRQRLKLE